jgi:hypothetical protein
MSVNAYRAYGLRIHAEISCPELRSDPVSTADPDVTIRLLQPIREISESLENGCYEVKPGVFRFAVPEVAQYLVEEGSRIYIEPFAGGSAEEVRLFLLGSVMGALLYQRGLFPLHGSAVKTRWGAMIFVGDQGVGKSTLASQFFRRGYSLLSDDVCAVTETPAELNVLPALAQMRLCADAYKRLGQRVGSRFHVDKFVVPLEEQYCDQVLPLRAIHILANREEPGVEFRILHGFDRVQRLLENLYRPHYLKGQGTQRDLMRLAGSIAQKATIVRVSRRRDPEKIDTLVDLLESSWAEHFNEIRGPEHHASF